MGTDGKSSGPAVTKHSTATLPAGGAWSGITVTMIPETDMTGGRMWNVAESYVMAGNEDLWSKPTQVPVAIGSTRVFGDAQPPQPRKSSRRRSTRGSIGVLITATLARVGSLGLTIDQVQQQADMSANRWSTSMGAGSLAFTRSSGMTTSPPVDRSPFEAVQVKVTPDGDLGIGCS